jgi:hypothetical protein
LHVTCRSFVEIFTRPPILQLCWDVLTSLHFCRSCVELCMWYL